MHADQKQTIIDSETNTLIENLFNSKTIKASLQGQAEDLASELKKQYQKATQLSLCEPILQFFDKLIKIKKNYGIGPQDLGFGRNALTQLALSHQQIDEHMVSVGGRLTKARAIVADAFERACGYMELAGSEAPSGLELWPRIQENTERIKKTLKIDDAQWNSYAGQLTHIIDSVNTLGKILRLPPSALADVLRVTKHFRMRLTPYYASLIIPEAINDPVLLQAVPTGEMVDNTGIEIPPVAADHSPARLIDQFYPRTVTIKATNMCAMYCTHCLRIAHIGKKDRVYAQAAYQEAMGYIRENPMIRDVLITGGDALALPNKTIAWILEELDSIDHVHIKRMGTRIPVTCPWRVDDELLDILQKSNAQKPLRLVTQVNTAQEITPVSKSAFQRISNSVAAVLNQAVLLRGINDSEHKMWKLCETLQESYIRPYYVFNCSYRNPQFSHMRVPVAKGREIIESMYGNISGDAIPRYIATAGGKIPLHRDNVFGHDNGNYVLSKPWSGEHVQYPDADASVYSNPMFAFAKYSAPK